MKIQEADGEFRPNLDGGDRAKLIKYDQMKEYLAIKVAKVLGFRVAGVNLVRSAHGPLILEVNSFPNLE